ncbi:MAG TPA: polysaccharide deacetylase family protein [Pilimelia sp.]|nr:polysaccharide deacetylase family protein [Pilimelia sp.]
MPRSRPHRGFARRAVARVAAVAALLAAAPGAAPPPAAASPPGGPAGAARPAADTPRPGSGASGPDATGAAAGPDAVGPAMAARGRAGAVSPPASRSGAGTGVVALTFDDGPSPYTPQVLAVLRRHGVPATFFALGYQVRTHPDIARRIVADGHVLANHTVYHPDLRTLGDAEARDQVLRTQEMIRDATGRTAAAFRFPYGGADDRTRAAVSRAGLRRVGWDIDTADWSGPGPRRIREQVLREVRPQQLSVVLMHDGGGDRSGTVAALDGLIRALKARGYRFGTV